MNPTGAVEVSSFARAQAGARADWETPYSLAISPRDYKVFVVLSTWSGPR